VCVDYVLSYTIKQQTCQPQLFLGMYDYITAVTFMQQLYIGILAALVVYSYYCS